MRLLASSRLILRLARRDVRRHVGRSILALSMIALPVLAVTTALVSASTSRVSDVESLGRRLGTAAALIQTAPGNGRIQQAPDPDDGTFVGPGGGGGPATSAGQIHTVLGPRALVPIRERQADVEVGRGSTFGVVSAQVTETDLRDPLTQGLFRLVSGRWPRGSGEVVVNSALAGRGYAVGDRLRLRAGVGGDRTIAAGPLVVGLADSTAVRDEPYVAGAVGVLGAAEPTDDGSRSWLAGGSPVSWREVRALNAVGATVLSREVIERPPPADQVPSALRPQRDTSSLQVLALIAAMALLEVVLLAGPAFAVTARRQQRSLALLMSSGATPRQAGRVVLASALTLGGIASVGGIGLGIALARGLEPALQSHSDTVFGPFQVNGLPLLAVAGFGLLSALLAAIVPARTASRQDVVAVLAGRRGERRPSARSPIAGLVLIGLGVVASIGGATGRGTTLIAVGAVLAVIGTVLVIPVVLSALGAVSGRLPLVLRYAVRDAARHRSRTAPAVAAVAATAAGVMALSIGLASDQEQNRALYQPSLAPGVGMLTAVSNVDWSVLREVATRSVPGATITAERGLPDAVGTGYTETTVTVAGHAVETGGTQALGSTVLISAGRLPVGSAGLSRAMATRVQAALRSGTSVVFALAGSGAGDRAVTRSDPARILRVTNDDRGAVVARRATRVPVLVVPVSATAWRGPTVLLTPAAAASLAGPKDRAQTVGLAISGRPITDAEQARLSESARTVSTDTSVYVERGFQQDTATKIVQWILIALGAVLTLGGTLTATFLALSDARPDLATLAAVGAAPRTRRGVAAAYALVVGLVGTVLGAVVGLIPGIAVTYPLTGPASNGGVGGPFLVVPWAPVLALVIALPILTAAAVGLAARSRLPMVARLD